MRSLPPLEDIRPPPNLSPSPDRDTRRGLSDYTGKAARNRVLYINVGVFKYGTNDKTHAAAIVLSMALLLAVLLLVFVGTRQGDAAWSDKAFAWLTNAFLFVAGVALGRGGLERHHDDGDL